jgi:NTP pyrophosphatase (non-canonical NTP hydrolase)
MVTIKKCQDWVREAWKKSPKKANEKDELLFLMEEIGEMAEAVRKLNGNKENKEFSVNLSKEFGDILLSVITLAIRYDIDLEHAFNETKKSIVRRYIKNDLRNKRFRIKRNC